MTEPAVPVLNVGYPQSRKQLRSGPGGGGSNPLYQFLETQCVDVIEHFDDFRDQELDLFRWEVGGTSDRPFAVIQPNEWRGIAEGSASGGEYTYLFGRNLPMYARNRPILETRATFIGFPDSAKFEIGFIDGIPGEKPGLVGGPGAVYSKSAPTANSRDFGVICFDTDDSTNIGIVGNYITTETDTDNSTVLDGFAAASLDPTLAAGDTNDVVFLLSLTEQGDARMWLNGAYIGEITTGPSRRSRIYPWVFVQGRSTGIVMQLDYIRAWQERIALI
jgi:hypothetical protein